MMKGVIQTLPSTRFVCVRTSFSTNFWWSLFLLFEWIHPSIDQQCSHADAEHMTPETLYANQASSLNMGSPVLLSVTPSTNVSIQVVWGSFIISGVKAPWASSFTSSSKRYCTHNVISWVWQSYAQCNVNVMASWEKKFLLSKKSFLEDGEN